MEAENLRQVQKRELRVRTLHGEVVLPARYGRDRDSGKMVMPLREHLGLHGHQPMSPALEEHLCYVAVATSSYGQAALLARKFGLAADDSLIQRVVQRAGERAEAQAARRVRAAFDPKGNRAVAREAGRALGDERFSLVLMLDGTMLRSRGADWGLKPSAAPGERVAWHELKAGLVIRLPEPVDGRRRRIAKFYVADAGGPEAIGRKLYAEALRRGLEQAQRVYVVADGAVWIWRLVEEHFPGSRETLDFYHASEHLWALARVLWHGDEKAAGEWVTPLLHNLKTRGGKELLSLLEGLQKTSDAGHDSEQRQVLIREAAYFHSHECRLDYPGAERSGLPIGSGEMESACSQIQGRFKRTGQFWSKPGERHLMALEIARRNDDWDELWPQTA